MGLAAALLFFQIPVAFGDILVRSIGKITPENRGLAVGILIISALGAEICLGGQIAPPPGKQNVVKIREVLRVKSWMGSSDSQPMGFYYFHRNWSYDLLWITPPPGGQQCNTYGPSLTV